ncbi:MAG: hypothetical protein N2314_00275 [Brevinematales bacterium]|nr:hypothetical protein [Brevinematales bacterium]
MGEKKIFEGEARHKGWLRVVLLLGIVPFLFAQEVREAEPSRKKDISSRTFALGIDVGTAIISLVFGSVVYPFVGEYAITKHVALQAEMAVSDGESFQGGGGARYYFDGRGLSGFWLGGSVDYVRIRYFFGMDSGWEATCLGGIKAVFGYVFVDGAVGWRYIKTEYQSVGGNRLFVSMGVCF